jgi:hypothetical protein
VKKMMHKKQEVERERDKDVLKIEERALGYENGNLIEKTK